MPCFVSLLVAAVALYRKENFLARCSNTKSSMMSPK